MMKELAELSSAISELCIVTVYVCHSECSNIEVNKFHRERGGHAATASARPGVGQQDTDGGG